MISSVKNFINDGYMFTQKATAFYKDKFPTQAVPLVSYGYSLGGATAVGIERLHGGKDHKVFSAHVLVAPNMGLDTAMQVPEDKLKSIYELPAATELFPFVASQADYLVEYYADPLQYTGQVLAGTFLCSMIELAEDN